MSILLMCLTHAFGESNADTHADFYIRIYHNQFGEGSNGTVSVNISSLKTSEGKLHAGSIFGSEEGKTGFRLYWKESVGHHNKFVMIISEDLGNVYVDNITKEFIYVPENDPFIIYSNSAHSIKLVHSLSFNDQCLGNNNSE